MSTLVIGVGSPFGDDRAGWEVVTALEALRSAAAPWPGVETWICDRPGASLVHLLAGVDHLVIVDAARAPGWPSGTIRWLDPREIDAGHATSSHGFGLAETLALADALGDTPSRVEVLAIAAAQFDGEVLSDAVRAAVPGAAREILVRIGKASPPARGAKGIDASDSEPPGGAAA